jgi:hypothetical protein
MNPYRAFANLKLQLYIYQRPLNCLAIAYLIYPSYFAFREEQTKYCGHYNEELKLAKKAGLIYMRIR